jgi:ABC-type dipeptide/oligopeptide/nickel transport system permease subunit
MTIEEASKPGSSPIPNVFVNTLKSDSPTRQALKRLIHHPSAQVGLAILGIMLFIAIFADLLVPFDPTLPLKGVVRRDTPCVHLFGCAADQPEHIMGIDGNSRDLFSRVLYGSRMSLQIGVSTITFAILIGGILGSIAGFLGGWLDTLIMRIMDVLMAFPGLLLSIAIVSVLGPGIINAMIAIAIVEIPIFARVMRAGVLSVKEMDYVYASRSMGASNTRLLFTRVIPNALTPLIVQGTLGIATAILNGAALSFLGLGAQPPIPEWGQMLSEERNSVFNAPHLVIFPGMAIMLLVLAFNLTGDALRDALDPRLRGKAA